VALGASLGLVVSYQGGWLDEHHDANFRQSAGAPGNSPALLLVGAVGASREGVVDGPESSSISPS